MPKANTYILEVGTDTLAAERLEIGNEIYNPYSQLFLRRVGIRPNMRILDIGCGLGIMTCWLANQAKEGEVVGLDISSEQLAIARDLAAKQKISHIKFIEKDIYEINHELGTFDLIWGRFFLIHLQNPATALQKLKSLLRPKGVLALEEPNKFTIYSDPHHFAITTCLDWFAQINTIKQLHFSIGPTLTSSFLGLGLQNVSCQTIHPTFQGRRQRNHMAMVIQEIKPTLLGLGIAEDDEIDDIIDQLYQLAADENYVMGHMQQFQVCGWNGSSLV